MKSHLRVVWGSFALLVAMLVLAPMALAAPVFKSTNRDGSPVALTLYNDRCSDPTVLKHMAMQVRPELMDKFKNAKLHWQGKDWASCWIQHEGIVYSLDEEGSPFQPVPREFFRDGSV